MTFELRLILCVFMALYTTQNAAQKPILRLGLSRENEQASLSDKGRVAGRYTQKDRNKEIDDNKLQSSLYRAQKPILRGKFKNENKLSMLRAVDQLVDNRNKDRDNNIYNGGYIYRYTESDDSYEESNDNRFKDREHNRMKYGNSIETLNKGMNNILAILLPNGQSYKKSESDLSVESDEKIQDATKIIDDLIFLRSGTWKSCGKKASKGCRKACEEAIKRGCSGSSCKSRAKKRMKKDCKSACKDRFAIDESVETEYDNDVTTSPPVIQSTRFSGINNVNNVESASVDSD